MGHMPGVLWKRSNIMIFLICKQVIDPTWHLRKCQLPHLVVLKNLYNSIDNQIIEADRLCFGDRSRWLAVSLVSEVMPIDRVNDAFDAMHRGESIRSILTF